MPRPEAGSSLGTAPWGSPAGHGPAAHWWSLVDHVSEPVVVLDGDGRAVLANRAARAAFPGLDTTGADGSGGAAPAVLTTLADAGRGDDLAAAVITESDGRRVAWRARPLGDDHIAWHAGTGEPGAGNGTGTADTGDSADNGTDTTGNDTDTADLLTRLSLLVEGPLTPEHVADAVTQLAVPALAAGCVLVLPAARGRFDWWRNTESGPPERGRVGQESVRAVPGLIEALSERDGAHRATVVPAEAAAATWLVPKDFGPLRDVPVLPLAAAAGSPGVLILLSGPDHVPAGRDLVAEFVRRSGVALGTALRFREQADVSAGLQSSLLPTPLPNVAGVRFAAAYRPARSGLRVGGDFYDVHPASGEQAGSAVFALGDACGHGPEAASLAGHVRSCLGALRLVEDSPDRLLVLLNQAIRTTSGSRFTTAVLGNLTVRDGGRVRLVLGCAGHPAPLVLRVGGAVEDVIVTGGLLGVFPEVQFDRTEVTLDPGEVCLLYSDGVTEARRGDSSGEQFGSERLRAVVRAHAGEHADRLVDAVHTELDRWLAGRNHDDITLLAIQAAPARN